MAVMATRNRRGKQQSDAAMNNSTTNRGSTWHPLKNYGALAAMMALTLSSVAVERLPFLNAAGQTYSNVLVTSVTATDLYFSHASGMGNVKLKQLDKALQKRFNYNPTNSANAANSQAEATRKFYMQRAGEKPPAIGRETETRPPPNRPAGIRREEIRAKRFLGEPPPPLTVAKWLTSQPDTTGKFVLIDFWATWCGPCRNVIPKLNAMQKHFGDRLVVIGLSDESEAEVRQMQNPKIEYAEAIDPRARTKSAVGVTAIPHVILMDPQGIVRFEGNPGSLSMEEVNYILQVYAQ